MTMDTITAPIVESLLNVEPKPLDLNEENLEKVIDEINQMIKDKGIQIKINPTWAWIPGKGIQYVEESNWGSDWVDDGC